MVQQPRRFSGATRMHQIQTRALDAQFLVKTDGKGRVRTIVTLQSRWKKEKVPVRTVKAVHRRMFVERPDARRTLTTLPTEPIMG
jgi:hypothetical protein